MSKTLHRLLPVLMLLLLSAFSQTTRADPGNETSAIDRRLLLTQSAEDNPFAIAAYKSNYALPLTFTSNPIINEGQVAEIKFQISLMVPVWSNRFGGDLFTGFG